MMPRRLLTVSAILISLAPIGLISSHLLMGAPGAEPVYTPAQLASLRQRNPHAWYGRTVLVRGWLEHTGPSCPLAVRCVIPGWMINRDPCPRPARCAHALVDMIGTHVPRVGWDYATELVVPASHVPLPALTLSQFILNYFAGVPFVDQYVQDTGSVYRVRLLPQAPCQGPTVIVGVGCFVCQPDAIRV